MEENSDDLLDQWLNINEQNKETEISDKEYIPKAPRSEYYPLSIAQRRLLFVYQKNPESAVYNYSEIWNFQNGSFDEAEFMQALENLVEKHQILASNYVVFQEEPAMVYRRDQKFSLEVLDGIRTETDARKWLKSLASFPFRLESDPLMRVGICRLEDGNHAIGITFHHIVIDAWSMRILKEDFAKLYGHGKSLESEKPEFQYRDYTVWQKELQKRPVNQISSQSSVDSFVELPLDYARPAHPSYNGKLTRFSLPDILTPKIGEILKALQTTDFNLFLACFQILLGRYGKSEKVNVGIPVLNRDKEEFKSIVGFFVDTQVIGGSLKNHKSFSDFLKEVKADVLKAISGQNESYEELLNSSKKLKDQSYNPLFQAMFVGHSIGDNPFRNNGLPVDFEILDLNVSKFDLTLHHFGLKNGAYQIGVEFSTDLFSSAFSERLAGHFIQLLKEICDNPQLALKNYSLISGEERDFLISGLSHQFQPESTGNVLNEILQNLSAKKDQTAVVCGPDRLTYGELDHRSSVVALELEKQNIDIEQSIGIYMERSVDFLVSILAILKIGRPYLPLDPEYPDQRILQYIQESGTKYVLSHSALMNGKASIKKIIESVEIDLLDYNYINDNQVIKSNISGENAYLIFTSGSTNKPKGVLVSHKNLYSSIKARKAYYKEAPTSFLLLSSFSFDSSVAGVFWSLCTGGKLVITQDNETLNTGALSSIISREEVSHTLMLPSLYQALLQGKDSERKALKGVILAGEEFPNELIAAHFAKHPNTRLFNEYGPTEGTVWCTVQEVMKGDSFHRVPIGLATGNSLAYVLDENQELIPTGISGELCIAGAGLVNGYLSDDDTSDKFVKNSFSEEWERIYRTGDLVRIQENGLLEYLGRLDNQVKIRGHRVELTEIQELANRFMGVTSSIALVGEERNQQIVLAYKSSGDFPDAKLASFLRQNLPRYMIPDILLQLQEFPLLPNGKVDLKKLSELAASKPKTTNETLKEPSNYLEGQVAGIWADIMGVNQVPVNRDFSELGGNSLQSIRIIARCRDIGLKVTPAQFLRYSTVESLVESLQYEEYTRPQNIVELEVLSVWEKFLGQKLIGVKDSFEKNGGSIFEWIRVEEDLTSNYTFSNPIQITDSIKEISLKISTKDDLVKLKLNPINRIIPIKTTGAKSPVFCIHSEFYYETVYSQLTRSLPTEYPVYGVLSVSPELVKDSVPKNIEEIASLGLKEIKLIQKQGPYRILSYSIGNVVAFELAKQLLEAGEQVKLIMIDPILFLDESRTFVRHGYRKIYAYLNYFKKPAKLFQRVLKKLKLAPKQPVLFQDTGLLEKYIKAYNPDKINCDALVITTPEEYKYTFGWEPLVNIVDKEEIQGPHLELMCEPYVSQINEIIARNLKKWDHE